MNQQVISEGNWPKWSTDHGCLEKESGSEPEILPLPWETKFGLCCWRVSGDRSSWTKIPFTVKCFRLKWFARTRRWFSGWSQLQKNGSRTWGGGVINFRLLVYLSMRNISFTGVGLPVKNSSIPFRVHGIMESSRFLGTKHYQILTLVSKSAKDPGPGRMFERRTWGRSIIAKSSGIRLTRKVSN